MTLELNDEDISFMTMSDAEREAFEAARHASQRLYRARALVDGLPTPVDWDAVANAEDATDEFLVEPFIVRRRQHAVAAEFKTGKSLWELEMSAAVASGRPIFNRPASKPESVVVIDFENDIRRDVWEHLRKFGYEPGELSNLHYFSFPLIDPLDTEAGGRMLEAIILMYDPVLVAFDSFARVVAGAENDADTLRAFYRHTMTVLKRAGVASIRLDNTGKDATKGARGSNAKGDDVDVILGLRKVASLDDGNDVTLEVTCAAQRTGNLVPAKTQVRRREDERGHLWHELPPDASWPAGTAALAATLDRLEVPLAASQRGAQAILKENDEGARTATLLAALKYRQHRRESVENLVVDRGSSAEAPDISAGQAPRDPRGRSMRPWGGASESERASAIFDNDEQDDRQ